MAAFVTGGSGFLGGALIRTLTKSGTPVRALVRSEAAKAAVIKNNAGAAPVLTCVTGDVTDAASVLSPGMEGCDVVYHCAALVNDWAPLADSLRVNVTGTQNVLEAARIARVRRVVHVSTEAVLADGNPIVDVDETAPRTAHPLGVYPISKGRAEEVCEAAVREHGQDVVIVRPRFIWGRGDTTVLPRAVETVRSGAFKWPGGGAHLTSTCHVENVVEGMIAAASRGSGATPGAIYFLTDGTDRTFREVMTAMLATQGIEAPTGSLPLWLLKPAAWTLETAASVFGFQPPITRSALGLMGVQVTVKDGKARRELGYKAAKGWEEGLRELAEDHAAAEAAKAGGAGAGARAAAGAGGHATCAPVASSPSPAAPASAATAAASAPASTASTASTATTPAS